MGVVKPFFLCTVWLCYSCTVISSKNSGIHQTTVYYFLLVKQWPLALYWPFNLMMQVDSIFLGENAFIHGDTIVEFNIGEKRSWGD